MGTDVLGVSITGLRVSQNALRTIGHNIANANTEGYSRQENVIGSAGASQTGIGYLGDGAYTAKVERVVNEFATKQIRTDTSLYNEASVYHENILQVNDLLANESTGLTRGLQDFFAATQNVTDDPSSFASRQLFLSESENLADKFNTLYSRLSQLDSSVNNNLEAAVNNVNGLVTQLATLNRSISDALGSSENHSPNDLLDQRDEALRKLSELVSIQAVVQDDQQVNISLGNGLPLLVGTNASAITLGSNEFDPLSSDIYLKDSSITDPISSFFKGGTIGGLLEVKNDVINNTLNDLGRIGLVISDNFNQLQQQGITLNNTFGTNLFADINEESVTLSRVLPSINNTTNDQLAAVVIEDSSLLTSSDYRISVNSVSGYEVVRLSDNAIVDSGSSIPATINFDGLSFSMQSGTINGGDEFLIQPTRSAASHFSALPLTPDDIALSSPVLTDTNLGNLGSATISAGEVLGLTDTTGAALPLFAQAGQMSPPFIVKFTTPTTYDVLDNSDPGNPVQLSPPLRNQEYVPGIQNNLFTSNIGQQTVTSNGANLGLPAGSTEVAAGTGVNGYPSETFDFVTTDPITGAVSTQSVTSALNASARTTAGLIDNTAGVSATAFNYLEINDVSAAFSVPLQITLNGQSLVQYDGAAIAAGVPSTAINGGEDFNDYLASQINNDENFSAQGIYAVSAYDAVADDFYLQIHSTVGDDLTVQLESASGSMDVNDGNNPDVTLTGTGAGNVTEVVVGGRIDVSLDENIAMNTTPATSGIFGDSTAVNFSQTSYWGIQASITGSASAGDTFTLDFNNDASLDNRNGLAMVNLQQLKTIGGNSETYNDAYNQLIETVGINTNSAQNDLSAAENVLEQSVNLRNSISGVNLDEEAANLIRFEQLYAANAQVINVARELFDRLLNSF